MIGRFLLLCLIMTLAPHARAQETPVSGLEDEQRLSNLLTLSEVALSSAALLRGYYPDALRKFTWNAGYDGGSWSMTVVSEGSDPRLIIKFSGGLEAPGSNGDGWSIAYSGEGEYGREPVFLEGFSVFEAAELESGPVALAAMNFSQTIRVGTATKYGWIKASEWILGGALGAAGGIIAAPATGGASLVIGLSAALGAGASASSLSEDVRTYFDSEGTAPDQDAPVSGNEFTEPDAPARPPLPEPGKLMNPNGDYTLVDANLSAGVLVGSFPQDGLVLHGTFALQSGEASGWMGLEEDSQ